MSIHRWSEDVILVDLPGQIEKQNELQTVLRMLRMGSDCDVVIDFSRADVVGGACLAGLLKIQRLVNECGHKLTLCSVSPATKGVFIVAHLDDRFEFAEDRFAALASLQLVGEDRLAVPVTPCQAWDFMPPGPPISRLAV